MMKFSKSNTFKQMRKQELHMRIIFFVAIMVMVNFLNNLGKATAMNLNDSVVVANGDVISNITFVNTKASTIEVPSGFYSAMYEKAKGTIVYSFNIQDIRKQSHLDDFLYSVILHHRYVGITKAIERECACHSAHDGEESVIKALADEHFPSKTVDMNISNSDTEEMHGCVSHFGTVYLRIMNNFNELLPLVSVYDSLVKGDSICAEKIKPPVSHNESLIRKRQEISIYNHVSLPKAKKSSSSSDYLERNEIFGKPKLESLFEKNSDLINHSKIWSGKKAKLHFTREKKDVCDLNHFVSKEQAHERIIKRYKKSGRRPPEGIELEKLTAKEMEHNKPCDDNVITENLIFRKSAEYVDIYANHGKDLFYDRGGSPSWKAIVEGICSSKKSAKKIICNANNITVDDVETYFRNLKTSFKPIDRAFMIFMDQKYEQDTDPVTSNLPRIEGFYRDLRPPKYCEDAEEVSKGSGKVAHSVIALLKKVKAVCPNVAFTFNSYCRHFWGEYSVDVWLSDRDDRRFFQKDKVIILLNALYDVFKAENAKWHVLYNDFSVAKEFNLLKGAQFVRIEKMHGPDPFISHMHVDIYPQEMKPILTAAGYSQTKVKVHSGDTTISISACPSKIPDGGFCDAK